MTLNLEKFRYVPSLEQRAKFLITLQSCQRRLFKPNQSIRNNLRYDDKDLFLFKPGNEYIA